MKFNFVKNLSFTRKGIINMKTLFNKEDYRRLKDGETYKNKFVIIDPDFFSEEYKEAKYQLFYAEGGFGCDPKNLGTAVFGRDYSETYRQERYNILGVATERAILEWEQLYNISRDAFLERKSNEI